jgi:serine protein kinase
MTLTSKIAALQNYKVYENLHWEGSYEEYLKLVQKNPRVTRNAYQRAYDMILSHGEEEYMDNKKKLVRFSFFRDEQSGGADAIYGLDIPLMRLMSVLKSAAQGYGTEKRVILLHGPVGAPKTTKKGVQKGVYEHWPLGHRRLREIG